MAGSNFDLKGFLNDPQVQADKAGAVRFLQQKGIIDAQGNVIESAIKHPLPWYADPIGALKKIPYVGGLFGSAESAAVGAGTAITGAGIGLAKLPFEVAQYGLNKIGAPPIIGQYTGAATQGLEDIQSSIEKSVKPELSSISGKVGQLAGDVAVITSPSKGLATTKEFLGGVPRELGLTGKLGTVARIAARSIPEIGVGTGFGLVKGQDIGGAAKTGLAFGFFSGLFDTVGEAYRALRGGLSENIGRGLGITGRMNTTGALGKVAKSADALKVIVDNAKGVLVKDSSGVEKIFEPSKSTFGEVLQAFKSVKDKVYLEYTSMAVEAGDIGAKFTAKDFYSLIDKLNSLKKDAVGGTVAAVERYIADIQRNFGSRKFFQTTELSRLQKFLENVNTNVNPLSDKPGAEVAGNLSREIRSILDEKIEKATGEAYQATRTKYAALKSIESDLVNQFKRALRGTKGGTFGTFLEEYGGLDMIVASLRGDIPGIVKGAGISAIGAIRNYLKNPESNLQRAFQFIENLGKEANPPSAIGTVSKSIPKALVPEAIGGMPIREEDKE